MKLPNRSSAGRRCERLTVELKRIVGRKSGWCKVNCEVEPSYFDGDGQVARARRPMGQVAS